MSIFSLFLYMFCTHVTFLYTSTRGRDKDNIQANITETSGRQATQRRRLFATELLLFNPCPMRNVTDIRGSANETEEQTMRTALRFRGLAVLLVALMTSSAWADNYSDTVDVFKNAIPSAFFENSYGYALFPTIGKGGAGIGGAHGKGQVYAKGVHVGDTTMTQLTIGFQLGGQAFSQIIFFEDERAFTQFSSGNFEFGAQATAVAITAGASATATTTGKSAGASGGRNDAKSVGEYHRGMATFTIAKGGLMYEASIGGQKFQYKNVKSPD